MEKSCHPFILCSPLTFVSRCLTADISILNFKIWTRPYVFMRGQFVNKYLVKPEPFNIQTTLMSQQRSKLVMWLKVLSNGLISLTEDTFPVDPLCIYLLLYQKLVYPSLWLVHTFKSASDSLTIRISIERKISESSCTNLRLIATNLSLRIVLSVKRDVLLFAQDTEVQCEGGSLKV